MCERIIVVFASWRERIPDGSGAIASRSAEFFLTETLLFFVFVVNANVGVALDI